MSKVFSFLTVIYSLFLLWISIQPIYFPTPEYFPWQDKIIHLGLYTGFAIVISLSWLQEKWERAPLFLQGITLLIVMIYGLILETCQIFVPTRSFEWIDILANLIGGLVGVYFSIPLRKINSKLHLPKYKT